MNTVKELIIELEKDQLKLSKMKHKKEKKNSNRQKLIKMLLES